MVPRHYFFSLSICFVTMELWKAQQSYIILQLHLEFHSFIWKSFFCNVNMSLLFQKLFGVLSVKHSFFGSVLGTNPWSPYMQVTLPMDSQHSLESWQTITNKKKTVAESSYSWKWFCVYYINKYYFPNIRNRHVYKYITLHNINWKQKMEKTFVLTFHKPFFQAWPSKSEGGSLTYHSEIHLPHLSQNKYYNVLAIVKDDPYSPARNTLFV